MLELSAGGKICSVFALAFVFVVVVVFHHFLGAGDASLFFFFFLGWMDTWMVSIKTPLARCYDNYAGLQQAQRQARQADSGL